MHEWDSFCYQCTEPEGDGLLHWVRGCKEVKNSRSCWEGKLRSCLCSHRHTYRWKSGYKENYWDFWTHLWCYSNITWGQITQALTASWYCWDQAHHAAIIEAWLQRYLCCFWADGIWSSPSYQSKWWLDAGSPSVFPLSDATCTEIYAYRWLFFYCKM